MNIFEILGKLNKNEHQFFTEGTKEERKGIAPLVLMRWMTGTTDPLQIIKLNSTINQYAFSLYEHPDLLMRMLASNGPGKFRKYNWLKFEGGRGTIKSATYDLYAEIYGYSISDYKDIEDLLTVDRVVDLALDAGYQQDRINPILKEWGEKVPKGSTTKRSKANTTSTPVVDDTLFE